MALSLRRITPEHFIQITCSLKRWSTGKICTGLSRLTAEQPIIQQHVCDWPMHWPITDTPESANKKCYIRENVVYKPDPVHCGLFKIVKLIQMYLFWDLTGITFIQLNSNLRYFIYPAFLMCHLYTVLSQSEHRSIWCVSYPHGVLATTLRLAALRINLSSVLTIWENLGRRFLSFTQQSSINWCRAVGQSMGGGRR